MQASASRLPGVWCLSTHLPFLLQWHLFFLLTQHTSIRLRWWRLYALTVPAYRHQHGNAQNKPAGWWLDLQLKIIIQSFNCNTVKQAVKYYMSNLYSLHFDSEGLLRFEANLKYKFCTKVQKYSITNKSYVFKLLLTCTNSESTHAGWNLSLYWIVIIDAFELMKEVYLHL